MASRIRKKSISRLSTMAMPPRRLRIARPLRESSRFLHRSITIPSSPQMKKYIAALPASEIGPMVSAGIPDSPL
jgi:hypothetical protein